MKYTNLMDIAWWCAHTHARACVRGYMFPQWLSSQESAWKAEDTGDTGSIPGSGRAWLPTPVFLPGVSHGQSGLVGSSPWGSQRSQTQLKWWREHNTSLSPYQIRIYTAPRGASVPLSRCYPPRDNHHDDFYHLWLGLPILEFHINWAMHCTFSSLTSFTEHNVCDHPCLCVRQWFILIVSIPTVWKCTIYPSILLWMGIWVISILELLQINYYEHLLYIECLFPPKILR